MIAPLVALALSHALGADASGCSAAELRDVVRTADVSRLGRVNGHDVVLASVHGSCLCGNVNCPYLVLRLDGANATVLLDTYAFALTPAGTQKPLPDLRERAHDSALVSVETIDTYRNGTYVVQSTARVRGDTGESKPDRIPVHFAPGASSAVLHGYVSPGWEDIYTFSAAPGQHITITGPAGFDYSLQTNDEKSDLDLKPGIPTRLPKGGAYVLLVDGGTEAGQHYTLTITIR